MYLWLHLPHIHGLLSVYESEAWVTYRCHLKTLEKFHKRCLRKILCIRWEDRCTNASVLMEANTTSIEQC